MIVGLVSASGRHGLMMGVVERLHLVGGKSGGHLCHSPPLGIPVEPGMVGCAAMAAWTAATTWRGIPAGITTCRPGRL